MRRDTVSLACLPGGVPVYKDPNAALRYEDGSPRLYTLCRATNPPCVLVHPDRWDEFMSALSRAGVAQR